MSKILIVDDSKSVHATISGILSMEGYEVDAVDDGYKALEAVQNNSYDIALVDIRMPGINGVETFKRLKKISPETTVVMMTAYAVSDLKKEAMKEGAYTILDKPFDMKKVIAMLSEVNKRDMVLIVDDDRNFRNTLKANFQKQGFKVVSVEGGEEALKVAGRRVPDIIILDVRMPGLTGPETLEKLNKAIEEFSRKPEIILVSGYDDTEEINKALSLGVKKFLKKPIDFEDLKKTIDELLEKEPGRDEAGEFSVLVVDDETYFREMLSETLSDAGYAVKSAENATRALAILKQEDCGVVLLDIRLPDISGIEVYEKISERHPGIKVIMMTAYAQDKELMEKIKKGGYTCLIKPFDMKKLKQMLNTEFGKGPEH